MKLALYRKSSMAWLSPSASMTTIAHSKTSRVKGKERMWHRRLLLLLSLEMIRVTVDPLLLPTSRSTRMTTKRSLDLVTALKTSSAERTVESSTCKTISPIFSPASSAADSGSISRMGAPWLAGFHSLTVSSVGEQSGCPFSEGRQTNAGKSIIGSFQVENFERDWVMLKGLYRRRLLLELNTQRLMSTSHHTDVKDHPAFRLGWRNVEPRTVVCCDGGRKQCYKMKKAVRLFGTWSNQKHA